MRKTVSFLNRFWGYQSGAVATEYAMLLVVVGGFAVAVILLVGALTGVLQDAADCVEVGCV